jgi:hypothetical protein
MKNAAIFILAALAIVAADSPPPIPAARHEEVSREMIALQQAQLQYQSYELLLAQSAKKVQEAQAAYDARVAALRKEFHVPDGCDLTVEKTWKCPPMPAKPAPTGSPDVH